MSSLLFFLFILAVFFVVISDWRKERKEHELLVQNILTTLFEKSAKARIIEELNVSGALMSRMRISNSGLVMSYESPLQKDGELSQVLSGILTNIVIEWNGSQYSAVDFKIIHTKEPAGQHREALSYTLILSTHAALPVRIDGIIEKKTATSLVCFSSFDEIVAVVL